MFVIIIIKLKAPFGVWGYEKSKDHTSQKRHRPTRASEADIGSPWPYQNECFPRGRSYTADIGNDQESGASGCSGGNLKIEDLKI